MAACSSTAGASGVELCELGTLGVRRDGDWTAIRGKRTKAALAAMSLRGSSGIRTEVLVEAVWPSPDQPSTARQSLANLVARVRSAFGADFVESTGDGYRLGECVQSDRARFAAEVEQAAQSLGDDPGAALTLIEQAFARWRGPPWTDVELPDEIAADRASLLDVARSGRRVHAAGLLSLDRPDEAVAVLTKLVDDDPTDETVWLDLAGALTQLSRRVDALRTIRTARRELANCGLTVGSMMAELEQQLLQGSTETSKATAEFPLEPTRILGRDTTITETTELLLTNPLVTLCGPGGVGKTRLAVALADRVEVAARYFVDLSPVHDQRRAASTIASTLGVIIPAGTAPTEALVEALRDARVLIVLDNCEQVLTAVTHVATELITHCGQLRIMVTSRERLALPAECVVTIEPLPSGPGEAGVELFFERTRRLGVDLDVDVWSDTVTELCEAVDGLPLAIELAAGRTTVLSPAEILGSLEDRFTLLRNPEVGRSLEQTIAWSWELLDDDERRALHQLSVFPSGATLDAASSVLQLDRWSMLELAEQLSRKSMLRIRQHPERPTRLELLDTVRFFVLADAELSGAVGACRDAHLGWVRDLTIETLGEHGDAPRDANPLIMIDIESHELRAALDHAESGPRAAAIGVRICDRCFNWWRGRTAAREGADRLTRLLRVADLDITDRVGAMASAASLARIAATQDVDVRVLVDEAYHLLEQIPLQEDRDRLELRLIEAHFDDRDQALGTRLRRLVDARASGNVLTALHLLTAWTLANRPAEAPAVAAELATAAATGTDACRAHSRELDGLAAVAVGDLEDARTCLAEAIDLLVTTGQTFCAIHCCESIAWLAIESGDLDSGRHLLAATEGLRRTHGRTRAGFEEQAIAGALRHLDRLPAPDPTMDAHGVIESARHALC